jgi:hypothetical protein
VCDDAAALFNYWTYPISFTVWLIRMGMQKMEKLSHFLSTTWLKSNIFKMTFFSVHSSWRLKPCAFFISLKLRHNNSAKNAWHVWSPSFDRWAKVKNNTSLDSSEAKTYTHIFNLIHQLFKLLQFKLSLLFTIQSFFLGVIIAPPIWWWPHLNAPLPRPDR